MLLLVGATSGLVGCRQGPDAPPPPTAPERPSPAPAPAPTPVAEPGSWVLPGVTVVDVDGVRGPVSVVITDGIVAAVLDGEVVPVHAEPLDVSGRWVAPGLVDPHVHLLLSGTASWVGDPLPGALRATVTHGVTTAVDAASPLEALALRDRIRAGEVLGPDVRMLGPMVTALGSHPCESVYDPDWCTFAQTLADAEAAVAARADADGVKLAIADASFSPWPTDRLDPDVAAAAAQVDGLVYAHVDEAEDVDIALDAGVDHLAHPVFGGALPEATLDRVVTAGVPVHTTLGAFSGVLELLDGTLPLDVAGGDPRTTAAWAWDRDHPGAFDPAWIAASEAWVARAEATLIQLDTVGVPILPASDAGYLYVPHGLGLHLELGRLADLGIDPERLLAMATAGNAAALGLVDRGRVAVGQRADLLVVDGDPRQDLARLSSPEWVVLAGAPWRREDLLDADPVQIAAPGPVGAFCVDERDCTGGGCDQVRHVCVQACEGTCGPDASCTAADGVDAPPVCRGVRTCDVYDATTCAPAPYRERCAPLDLDTAGCFPAGPRTEGEPCDPVVTERTCGPGLVCTLDDLQCHTPCSPEGGGCAGGLDCDVIEAGGVPWFGVCR